jgi:hypothetical protein
MNLYIKPVILTALIALSIVCLSSCKTGFMADNNLMSCVNNMRQIETAKRTFAMAYSTDNGDLLTRDQVEQLSTYMTGGKWSAHQCASGGRYTVGRLGQSPACNIHGTLEHIRTYLK